MICFIQVFTVGVLLIWVVLVLFEEGNENCFVLVGQSSSIVSDIRYYTADITLWFLWCIRVKKSMATGVQMKEAQAINKSLSALGDVISALASNSGHVPYRNHKLTMLMSDSLGGNAKTLMFVNVSPSDTNLDETQNSLQYAQRVRTIKNDPTKHEASKEAARLKRLIDSWKNPNMDAHAELLSAYGAA